MMRIGWIGHRAGVALAALAMLVAPGAARATSVVQYWNMPFASAFVEQTIAPQRVSAYNFFAHSMWFQNNPNGDDGMYIGLQQTGTSSSTRRAHFAIWNATAAYWAPPMQCASFSGEGVGKKCWIAYPYTTGQSYRLRVRRDHDDSLGTWWVATVIDPAGVEKTIGAIRAPRGTGNVASSASFDEYFSSACPAPASSSFFLAPAALDFYSPVYGSYGPNGAKQPCSNSRITHGYGGALLELGVTN